MDPFPIITLHYNPAQRPTSFLFPITKGSLIRLPVFILFLSTFWFPQLKSQSYHFVEVELTGESDTASYSDTTEYRDPYKWPFSKTSIWNMPIGTGVRYVDAGITPQTAKGSFAYNDVIIITPDEPLLDVCAFPGGWSSDRCLKGNFLGRLPIPADFYLPFTGKTVDHPAAILEQDHRTLNQSQPVHRCPENAFFTSKYWGYPNVDIYGEGTGGAHGGSALSSIGGTIRLGEFASGRIRHALKVCLFGKKYYYYDKTSDPTPGYRWPATKADGYADGTYAGTNPAMQMGSLLALKPDFDTSLCNTLPGKIIAQAFKDYGGYIVDDAAWDVFKIPVELSPEGNVTDEFKVLYGYDFEQKSMDHPWVKDLTRIFTNLYVIDNNSPDSIGGGGEPRISGAPDFLPFNYLTVETDETPGAAVNPPGTFPVHLGRVTNLSVQVDPPGYAFSHWEVTEGKAIIGDPAMSPTTLKIDSGDVTVKAVFRKEYYSLDISVSGTGSVNIFPSADSFDIDTSVKLEAIPEVDWRFEGWSGGLESTMNPLYLNLSANTSVRAVFVPDVYGLLFQVTGNGTILSDPDQDTLLNGTIVELTAKPDSGWIFASWGGDLSGNENPVSVTLTKDLTVLAFFDSIASIVSPGSNASDAFIYHDRSGNLLHFVFPGPEQVSRIRIFNICGIMLKDIRVLHGRHYMLNTSFLDQGLYFAKVDFKNNQGKTMKFIVI